MFNLFKGVCFLTSLLIVLLLYSCKSDPNNAVVSHNNQMHLQFDHNIRFAMMHLDSITYNTKHAEKHFKASRRYFKKIEPVLSFLDTENYAYLNQPNILKIEEEAFTDIKIKSPSGYQVLEETIFNDSVDTLLISKHVNLINHRLKLIQKNTQFNHLKPYHFLWLFRKAIHRVALTGITGFDSPVLENSLNDAQNVYTSLKESLSFFEPQFKDSELYKKWLLEIDLTIRELSGSFNNFDRYLFIKKHTHYQMVLWNETVADWNSSFPFELAIKNNASSLFSTSTFNIAYFSDPNFGDITLEKVNLGKRLFYDKNLSGDGSMSCASCHLPEKAFADGKKTPKEGFRNSPTLLYAALQKAFFYDKRAGSLEGQIIGVIENKKEFHTDLETLEKVIKKDTNYLLSFAKNYPNKKVNNLVIRNAIASYIRSLIPFNSKFDRNISNIENTLSQNEINGFNLFSGKAKCATCLFAPLFNGTVPPDYKESELELIGVPKENDTINARISEDLGRYNVFKTNERKHFFKTPTIRNANKTAPYMHNGVFNTLDEVIDFYNRGGGTGIGIHEPLQTLPSDSLRLNAQEIKNLISFIKTLDDTY